MSAFQLLNLPLSGLLLASSLLKIQHRRRKVAERSALGSLIHHRTALKVAWSGLVLTEIVIACAIIFLSPRAGGILAAGFFAGATVYAAVALRLSPERPCGCFGAELGLISWRTVGRALLLTTASAAYSASAGITAGAIRDPRGWLGVVVVLSAFVGLSPEIRTMLRQRALSRDCNLPMMSAELAGSTLKQTKAWRAMAKHIAADTPSSVWVEGCAHFYSFAANLEDKLATVLFIVTPLRGRALCHAMLRRGLTGNVILTTDEEHLRIPNHAEPILARLVPFALAGYPEWLRKR